MNYEHYTVKLKLLGPVHIGDGSKIGKYEYVCDGDKLYVFDAVVLFDMLFNKHPFKLLCAPRVGYFIELGFIGGIYFNFDYSENQETAH